MTQGMKLYCLRNRLDLSAHQVASIVGDGLHLLPQAGSPGSAEGVQRRTFW